MNVATLHEHFIEKFGNVVTTIFEDREYTSVYMRERANKLGNALVGLGIKQNDVVAVTMSNSLEVIQSFSGIFRIGAIVLPILFLLSAEEMKYILSDSKAVAVITDFTQEQKVLEAVEDLDTVKCVITVGAQDLARSLDFESILEKASGQLSAVEKDPDDLAMIMYTSGTTGKPKGVMLTHRNLVEGARSAYTANEVTKPTRGLMCLPLAHIYGVGAMNAGFLNEFKGSLSIIMRWFVPDEVFRLIEKYGIQLFPGVPAMFALLYNHPDAEKYNLSSLEDCVSGAAALPVDLQVGFMERFKCKMRQLYGLTESSGMGATVRPSHPFIPGTVGKAYDNQEIKIFDDDDNELPPGELGEIVIRGPQVMKGYLNLPEETEKALRNGWLHTGDVGYMDDDGFLFVTARKKDLIIKGGENIMPAQIEDVVAEHPAVSEAAAIGVPHDIYGEEIVVFVTIEPKMSATPEEILDFCSKKLIPFKRPGEIIIVDSLPKTLIGKVLKRELKEMYKQIKNREGKIG